MLFTIFLNHVNSILKYATSMSQVCISKLHLRDNDMCYPLIISSQQNHQHIRNLLEE